MRKFFVTATVAVVLLGSLAGDASAIGRRRQRYQTYVVTPVATAQATPSGAGYRTYSYEPSAGTAVDSTTSRTMRVPPYMNAGRHTAGYKLTDF